MKKILIFNSNNSFLPVLDGDFDVDISFTAADAAAKAMSGGYDAIAVCSCCVDVSFIPYLRSYAGERLLISLTDGDTPQRFIEAGVFTFCTKDTLNAALRDLVTDSRSKREQILIKSFNKLKHIASSVSQGILVFNAAGRVTFFNQAAADITGRPSKEMMFRTLDDIFSEHPYSAAKPCSYEQERHVTHGGRELLLDTSYSATDGDEDEAGFVLLFSRSSSTAIDRYQELELLKFKERYHSTQQHAAFKKQMLVIKDETSGTVSGRYAFETYFKPLDVMSGDVYGSINIKDGRYFFYIIDAMGKGLSASVTAVQSSSFINHAAELAIIKNDFDMSTLLSSFNRYIRDRLMDDEALCAVFATLDMTNDTLTVVGYGMPPVLVMRTDGTVERIRSLNMPIMRYITERKSATVSLADAEKFLIYSDGLSEAETKDASLYMDLLPLDFATSATKRHLLNKFNEATVSNDDDVTFFMISTREKTILKSDHFSVKSSQPQLAVAAQRVCAFIRDNGYDENDIMTMEFAMGEMLMNALEHGSLGISFEMKKRMVHDGTFDAYIAERAAEGTDEYEKPISVKCSLIRKAGIDKDILLTIISDSGMGFIVPEIFKYHSFDGNLCHIDSKSYNGRGIFITDNIVDGLFYNEQGNSVYIIKILG